MASLGLNFCVQVFKNCGEWGVLFSCNAQASCCGAFSCYRAQALGVGFHWLWGTSLVALWPVGSSQTRDWTCVPSLTGRSLTTGLPRKSFYCVFLPPLSWVNWLHKCGFISKLSIHFHLSISLFFCQYHVVFITVALCSSLKSRNVKLPALFFLKIVLVIRIICVSMQILFVLVLWRMLLVFW